MKKILFMYFIIFMNLSTCFAFNLGDRVDNMYIEAFDGKNRKSDRVYLITNEVGEIVYSIDPALSLSVNGTYREFTTIPYFLNLTEEQINKMNLIAYYGYGYKNHTEIKWYGITQYLIYKELDYDDVYFTDTYFGNKITVYEKEIEELNNLVSKHYILPSINEDIIVFPNKTNEFIDNNGVLNNFEIVYSNIDSKIKDNKLIINCLNKGTYTIKLKRKNNCLDEYIIYDVFASRPLLRPGNIEDIIIDIKVEVIGGSILVNNNISSEYELYKDDTFIKKIKKGKENLIISDLDFGEYKLKQTKVEDGYKVDNKFYNINITKEKVDHVVNIKEEKIKGELLINKYNNNKLDENAVFEIYKDNNIVGEIKSNEKLTLDYGEYLVKQIKGDVNYKYINQFKIFISKDKVYASDFYSYNKIEKENINEIEEVLIVNVPDTYKNDYKNYIALYMIILGSLIIKNSIKKRKQ